MEVESRRERAKRRREARYGRRGAYYQRRRWAAFLVLVGLASALILTNNAGPERVEVVRTPTVLPQPAPPVSLDGLEARLAEIASSHQGSYGAVVFDPDTGASAGLEPDRPFMAASLSKLPVMLTLYKAAARGELSLDEKISILPTDVQNYGTGVLNGYPVGSTMTLRESASYLIKESDNTAWVMLERRLSKDKIEGEISALGANDTDYRAFQTTPSDVLLMLRAIADPGYTSPDLSEEMLSLMTNTAYEDRLPELLPEDVRVAHKIGSYEDTFSDAGIIFQRDQEGKENNYFIVVVGRDTTETEARSAIRQMSLAAFQTFSSQLAISQGSSNQS